MITLNPSDGLRNVATYPTDPTTEADARNQIQSVIDQIIAQANADIGNLTKNCRAYNTTNQSIPNSVETALTFNSENYDTDTIHDTATNTSRFYCKTAGKYSFIANLAWDVNATGLRIAFIKLNGGTIVAASQMPAGSGTYTMHNFSGEYNMNVGDYVEVTGYQNSGAALNIATASSLGNTTFAMKKVG